MRRTVFFVLATILFVGALVGHAVEPEKPSKTSVWVLAARAVGAYDPDPSVRNPDWLAERFLGPDERAQIPDNYAVLALDQDYRVAMRNPTTRTLVLAMTVRTKFIDERLLNAVTGGVVQVVNLGAGFDSRAFRFRSELRNVRIFEVDYGPTQEYKRRRAAQVVGSTPANLVYVPIDFTRQTLADVLRRAGYRRDRKTFFIWEGVTMYIPNEAVRDTLRFIAANSPPGSAVVFDYYVASAFNELPKVSEYQRLMLAMVSDWGEPMIFGVPDGATREYVAEAGLSLVDNLPALGQEAVKQYLTRGDGTLAGDLPWPLTPPVLGEGRYPYYYASATVPALEPRLGK